MITQEIHSQLNYLSQQFKEYSTLTNKKRRFLVVRTRKLLYKITNLNKDEETFNAPKLRINGDIDLTIEKKDSLLKIDSAISSVKGIGIKITDSLSKLGILTIKDLILYFPKDYIDYSIIKRISELKSGETATILAYVRSVGSFISPRNKNLSILNINIQDISGKIKITKFFAGKRLSNKSFLKKQESLYTKGSLIAVSGLVKESSYGKTFVDPIIEILDNSYSIIKSASIGRILPIYSLTKGITAERIRSLISLCLPLVKDWPDPLPQERLSYLSLVPINQALLQIHRPTNKALLDSARKRIIFNEFLFMQLGLLLRRNQLKSRIAPKISITQVDNFLVNEFFKLLPFSLTDAQIRVLDEINNDLSLTEPMTRLVQGDVGSGKTIIAIATLLKAVQSKWQGVLMAPTEVLAQQHYKNLCKWLPQLNVRVELLTGSTNPGKRVEILNNLSSGNVDIIVGTHALIEDRVNFFRLGLVVVDEQHRFGVNQRNQLLSKGLQPHLLSMTATPIPRTLALSVHGDLDVSQIDQLPPGRTPIKTTLLKSSQRNKAFEIIKHKISLGEQAYYVLPLVEESENVDLRSAVDVFNELSQEIFTDLNIGLLHGRMKSKEKKLVLDDFHSGRLKILVSTTVIEVGIDVPEATVIIIDNADHFGLAQLHQLRGRVGRGTNFSECVLIDTGKTPQSKKRLEVLVNSNDGFEISELDLRLRGPGQILGTRQSGLPDFALANLIDDVSMLDLARNEAIYILNSDPFLEKNDLIKGCMESYKNRFSQEVQLN